MSITIDYFGFSILIIILYSGIHSLSSALIPEVIGINAALQFRFKYFYIILKPLCIRNTVTYDIYGIQILIFSAKISFQSLYLTGCAGEKDFPAIC